jgi:hypothetical protein
MGPIGMAFFYKEKGEKGDSLIFRKHWPEKLKDDRQKTSLSPFRLVRGKGDASQRLQQEAKIKYQKGRGIE